MPPRRKTIEELNAANEFIVHPGKRPPEQMIMGVTGIPAYRLIQAIIDNRGGEFDHLYKRAAVEKASA